MSVVAPTPDEVSAAVKRLQWRHHRTANTRLAELGLSLPQWDVLRQVHAHPDATLHALAELTYQTDQSMGALASRMVERGLLERVEGAGRAVHHRLTPRGEELRAQGATVVRTVFRQTVGRLSKDEAATLLRLLEKANAD